MSTLHAIIVANLEDQRIGCETDVKNWRQELATISKFAKMKLNKIEVMGEDWSRDTVMKTVKKLSPKKDDAVIFYYSGHGYRVPSMKSSQWPAIALQGHEGLGLAWVYRELSEKNPRFLLVMSDSCNNEIPEDAIHTIKGFRGVSLADVSKGYKSLFAKYTGKILASSSIPGQYSYGSPPEGGVYTSKFLTTLRKLVQDDAEWKTIMDVVNQPLSGGKQQPQFAINRDITEKEALRSLAPGFFSQQKMLKTFFGGCEYCTEDDLRNEMSLGELGAFLASEIY